MLTENQKKQYNDLFKSYFLKSFSGRLVGYSDAKIAVLSEEIKNSLYEKTQRVWVHTCSLDHKNALKNYISRGMKIFKKEKIEL